MIASRKLKKTKQAPTPKPQPRRNTFANSPINSNPMNWDDVPVGGKAPVAVVDNSYMSRHVENKFDSYSKFNQSTYRKKEEVMDPTTAYNILQGDDCKFPDVSDTRGYGQRAPDERASTLVQKHWSKTQPVNPSFNEKANTSVECSENDPATEKKLQELDEQIERFKKENELCKKLRLDRENMLQAAEEEKESLTRLLNQERENVEKQLSVERKKLAKERSKLADEKERVRISQAANQRAGNESKKATERMKELEEQLASKDAMHRQTVQRLQRQIATAQKQNQLLTEDLRQADADKSKLYQKISEMSREKGTYSPVSPRATYNSKPRSISPKEHPISSRATSSRALAVGGNPFRKSGRSHSMSVVSSPRPNVSPLKNVGPKVQTRRSVNSRPLASASEGSEPAWGSRTGAGVLALAESARLATNHWPSHAYNNSNFSNRDRNKEHSDGNGTSDFSFGGPGYGSGYGAEASTNEAAQQEEILPTGERVTTYPNGLKKSRFPDGRTVVSFQNGDTKETIKDGTVVYHYAETNTVQTSYVDGSQIFKFGSGQVERHYPDGYKEVDFPGGARKRVWGNGAVEVTFPDGTVKRTEGKK
eukprot:Platyproteum_vivax@DN7411_c0_g1_i1.p1